MSEVKLVESATLARDVYDIKGGGTLEIRQFNPDKEKSRRQAEISAITTGPDGKVTRKVALGMDEFNKKHKISHHRALESDPTYQGEKTPPSQAEKILFGDAPPSVGLLKSTMGWSHLLTNGHTLEIDIEPSLKNIDDPTMKTGRLLDENGKLLSTHTVRSDEKLPAAYNVPEPNKRPLRPSPGAVP